MCSNLLELWIFLNKAIVPGRAFTRGMYGKLKLTGAQGQLLKQHYHVHLGSEFVQDCHMWLYFLTQANSRQQLLCRPFLDFDELVPWQTLQFFSDASISSKLGFGATFDDQWIAGQWNATFIQESEPSIEFLELYAFTVALTVWRQHPGLQNCRIQIHCDNQAVMHMVNNLASSCSQCMKLIQIIALQGIVHGRRVRVIFVRSKNNILADTLSRMDFDHFWRHAPKSMSTKPCLLPCSFWPIQKVWDNPFNANLFEL